MGADTDTRDKVITLLEHRLEEQKRQHGIELERFLQQAERAKVDVEALHKEKIRELLAQNDGMLGVVGRLQVENEALKTKIHRLEGDVERAHIQGKVRHLELDAELEKVREESKMALAEKQVEIDRLKRKSKGKR